MRKIAITQRLVTNDSYYEVRETLDINYSKLLNSCGFLPIVLPYEVDFEKYFDEFEIDGVLFTGGNDLYSCSKNELSKKRDIFEISLLEFCVKRDIPLFGICRGMQLIAEYFGSSFKKVSGEVNTKSFLSINKSSKYYELLENLDSVNSYHNFSIDILSDELIASSTNEASVIKSIEHKKHKIFAQMWHSEREEQFKSSEIALIKEFFNLGVNSVIEIAKEASCAILDIYNSKDMEIEYKDDNSPVTKADLAANSIIIERLKTISNYPIVTEETPVKYNIRKNWSSFWLVDPLDGTQDFISKNGEFTINIALIRNCKPILGVVYIPVTGDVYYAVKNGGAFKNGDKIFNSSTREDLIASDSNFNSTKKTEDFFQGHNIKNIKKYGSSIKICKLAEGDIDVYPRYNGTKEWDTAATHIIANEAGCKIIDIETKKELLYNKESIKNNYFIACKDNLEFEI